MAITKATYGVISDNVPYQVSFDQASDTLHCEQGFDQKGAVITVPDGKQFNYIGIRNEGNPNVFTLEDTGMASCLSYYVRSSADSGSTSNLYSVVGNLYNAGAGSTKALYGRSIAESGCTGVVTGGVFRTQIDTGATPTTSYCLQMGPAGNLSKTLDMVIEMDHEQGTFGSPGYANYGIVQNANLLFKEAFIRGIANTGADFLRLQTATGGGGAVLFSVNANGDVLTESQVVVGTDHTVLTQGILQTLPTSANLEILCGSSGTLYLGSGDTGGIAPVAVYGNIFEIRDAAEGYRLNFDNNTSASAGSSAGYITIQVNGVDKKIQYFNVS